MQGTVYARAHEKANLQGPLISLNRRNYRASCPFCRIIYLWFLQVKSESSEINQRLETNGSKPLQVKSRFLET